MASTVADLDSDLAAAIVAAFPSSSRMADDFRTEFVAVPAASFGFQLRAQRVQFDVIAASRTEHVAAVELELHTRVGGHLTVIEPALVQILADSFFEDLASVKKIDPESPPTVTEGPTVNLNVYSYRVETQLWLASP